MNNLILNSDSYKSSHSEFYPDGSTAQFAYIAPRVKNETIVVFGLQMAIKRYLLMPITQRDIDEAVVLLTQHGVPFNKHGWEIILHEHGGLLPITIKGYPEGSVIESGKPIVTIETTDHRLYWLSSYVETFMQRAIWYPTTIASNGYKARGFLRKVYEETSDKQSALDFALHDFGARGVTSGESAAIGGIAHLVNFLGTDNLLALVAAKEYYNANKAIGYSIPATEHSVQCAYGCDNQDAYLDKVLLSKHKVVSIVLDGYDVYREVRLLCDKLRNMVTTQHTVLRPDCYDSETEIYTKQGWVLFEDLTDDDLVAQVLDDGSYEFVKPSAYHKSRYQGEMIHFTDFHGKVDSLVTPNHRMVVVKNSAMRIKYANEVSLNWNYKFIRSAYAKELGSVLSDIERLKIAFQADGSYVTNSTTKIRFGFYKTRKIDRMTELLTKLGYDYKAYQLKDGKIEIHTSVNALDYLKDFSWVDTSALSRQWCIDFIEELSYWDATRRSENRFKFDTTVGKVAKVVEQIATSAGYGCLMTIKSDDRKEIFSDVFTLHIMKDNLIGTQNINKNYVSYDGYVYCVTVPTGKLLVRRNKSILVSGNSGNPLEVIPRILSIVEDYFPSVLNSKGYKYFHNLSVIQGDGIDFDSMCKIATLVKDIGYAADVVTYGSGGGLLQRVTRDTYGFAQKTSAMEIDGTWLDVVKSPITDSTKASIGGRIEDPQMVTFYHNGELLVDDHIDRIRHRVSGII